MQPERPFTFGVYRLDAHTGQLWREKQEVRLTGKASAVLHYLLGRAGQTVTKEELFIAIWPDTVVSDAALTSCIQELRRALRDNAKNPRYLKTVHRRGFQFIGSLQPLGRSEPLPTSVSQREIERKLVAILSADVQGYSRLMGENELATIRTLTAYREVMTALIGQHRGRVVDAPGDNLLAEFASAVDAVQAAVAIQDDLKGRNAALPSYRQMHYRIGINVGDVVVEGGRLYGDGVNIAARLEALAEGGGICLSRSVYEQIKNKIALTYEYVGERTVKNIAEPVPVYRVKSASAADSPKHDTTARQNAAHGTRQKISSTPSPQCPVPTLVGRDGELAQLHAWLDKALRGERQVVFVSGEPGIGKTTVVETFLGQVSNEERLRIGRGQCVEHYGVGEAYLPVLEALGRLCREEDGNEVIALLRQQAPTWLVQMPSLLSAAEVEELQRRTVGVTRERMLRELAEALEGLTAERGLLLLFEDLHWSDYSTLDLLSVLARRRETVRLFLLGTYRPIEVLTRDHPLKGIKQELQVHGQCEEVALDFLSEAAVGEYLVQRFGAPSPASAGEGRGEGLSSEPRQRLAHVIHQRTDGNPLFMVNVVNDLVTQGVVAQTDGGWEIQGDVKEQTLRTPVNLRQMIEQQLARVSVEEHKMLEAASVAGAEFSAATVAAGVGQSAEAVETYCDGLVQREQFLRMRGTSEWPDGTVAARYGFVHALYQEVLYEQISASRRTRLHKQIGEREEVGYGAQVGERAAELAVHFERGREHRKAIQYLQHAGENAIQRSAQAEAITHLSKGLELLKTLPDTPERIQQELTLQTTLGPVLMAAKGYGAPELEQVYTRARELCRQLGETPQLFPVLWGLWAFYTVRADYESGRELGEQLLILARSVQDPALLLQAHSALGQAFSYPGEFGRARDHCEYGIALYDPRQHRSLAFLYGEDAGVACSCHAAWNLWHLGYAEQALKKNTDALTLARELSYSHSLALALCFAAMLHQFRREIQAVQEQAEVAMTLSTEQGFPHWLGLGAILRGWVLAEQGQAEEGIAQIHHGLAAWRATGSEWARIYFLSLLAEVYGKAGQTEDGLAALAEALTVVDKSGERFYEAELYRLKGTLTLQSKTSLKQVSGKSKTSQNKSKNTDPRPLTPDPQGEAEACFLKAIDIARKQQAKSLELRATASLARLWQQQGKQHEAHTMLSEIYTWFTEGFDTKDLQEAKTLIEELSH